MTRPAPRTRTVCKHCGQPILRLGLLWVHDRSVYDERCIVASRYTGTVAEPKAAGMTRHLIIVDCETTGLVPGIHVPIEIAALNTHTGEDLYIAPSVDPVCWGVAEPEALAINRYFERRVFDHVESMGAELEKAQRLGDWLHCNTLGGSNPRFDLAMLQDFLGRHEVDAEPHHRLADLSAFAAGVLGLDPTEQPGLAEVARRCGLGDPPDHTAMTDARVTWQCFKALKEIRAGVRHA